MMTEWELAHAIIGGVASFIFLVQTFGSAGDTDGDTDSPGDAGTGLADYLSVRNFVAFFIGYGWVALAALLSGASRPTASFAGVVAGLSFIVASLLLLKTFIKFQEDGTLKLETLIGQRASVYIAIGASGCSSGKVLVDTITGRVELPARTTGAEELRPGGSVIISGVEGGVLLVENDRD
ncbi:MAG: NfeD family protein [Synergistaceae bacterium]|jgi:membrane protein implicated in regulation of membrane protease activity|nr:NfeD family protein [Synergistaceae bacterium]